MKELKTYVVKREDGPDLEFQGELLAQACSSAERGSSNYSGMTGRWVELRLYKTAGGKYICERVYGSLWQGERNGHEAAVGREEAYVAQFFGYDRLAKELYWKAGINANTKID